MFVTYTPEGQAAQSFEFNVGRLRLSESAGIETAYSKQVGQAKTINHFVYDVRQGGAVARRVLLHWLLRKQHPTLRFDEVDPLESEVKVEGSRQELEELRADVANSKAIPDGEKREMLEAIDAEIAAAPESLESGKATGSASSTTGRSKSSGTATS